MIDWDKYPIIGGINSPEQVKGMSITDLKKLSEELRKLIIDVVSKNGGHLASNLGSIELTLALLKILKLLMT